MEQGRRFPDHVTLPIALNAVVNYDSPEKQSAGVNKCCLLLLIRSVYKELHADRETGC